MTPRDEYLISQAHPKFQPVLRLWLPDAQADLVASYPDWRVGLTETLRSVTAQLKAQAQGLSDLSFGWHQLGLAADYAIFNDTGAYVTDGAHPAYGLVGAVSARYGCHYPIILANGQQDRDHTEYHPGITLTEAVAAWKRGTEIFDA